MGEEDSGTTGYGESLLDTTTSDISTDYEMDEGQTKKKVVGDGDPKMEDDNEEDDYQEDDYEDDDYEDDDYEDDYDDDEDDEDGEEDDGDDEEEDEEAEPHMVLVSGKKVALKLLKQYRGRYMPKNIVDLCIHLLSKH